MADAGELRTHQVFKIVPQGMSARDCEVTEADRGTVAIMATIDKLDRQIRGIHQEMIMLVLDPVIVARPRPMLGHEA